MESHKGFLISVIGTFCIVVIHMAGAQDQQGYISLDCGLPVDDSPYNEPHVTLTYTSDAAFIQTGKIGKVHKDFAKRFTKQYWFLRYFPDGKRNCYNLNVTRYTNYMIAAYFVYGNYDGLNNLPNFDLYLGPNKWATIDLEGRVNGTREELIHIPRSNTLQICLVKTGITTPFISTLELRPLRNDSYLTQSGSLRLSFRIYSSSTGYHVRYPHDVHDRVWYPFLRFGWTQKTTTLDVNNTNIYEVPEYVLKTAATPTNVSEPLTLTWTQNPPHAEIYLYLHFAEIQSLQPNETREFDVQINGVVNFLALRPPNFKVLTAYIGTPFECNDGACNLQLIKTNKSTHPPLINAIEAFMGIEFPKSGTNPSDVAAIGDIKDTYTLSKISWQGDPCVPQQLSWESLNCSYSDMSTQPRITSLNLSSSGIFGNIAPSIQNLTQLQELDLSNNNLTGKVPKFLANMKSLLVLNLSGNNLHGSVPKALLDRQKNGLELHIEGNPDLCKSTSCGNDKKKLILPIVASVASVIIIILVLVVVSVLKKKKASTASRPSLNVQVAEDRSINTSRQSILMEKRRFMYSEIAVMTNNFQRALGRGGFGIVYHGYWDDTDQVAVKMLSQSSFQGYKQFKAEVELLLRVHHINLVSLVGYCDEGDDLALVYEYMHNGDLKQHLSGKCGGPALSWASRLRIALDASLGLEYLHIGCKPPMVHRDVKSTNILLDEHFHAKLADFGLSRSFPLGSESHVSTVIAGTPGYLDPEYYHTNWLTEKSDVYSFGIVLLEVMTNQPVIDQARQKPHIAEWVAFMLTKGSIKNIMDPNLCGDYENGSVWKVIELAMSCVNPSSTGRPDMSEVVHVLKECLTTENSRRGGSQDMESKSSEVSINFTTEVITKPR